MSADFISRIIGMLLLGAAGIILGSYLGEIGATPLYLSSIVMGLVGSLTGLILTPYFTTRMMRGILERVTHTSSPTFFSGLLGLVVGLVIAALTSIPLAQLPDSLGRYLPIVGAVVFGYLGAVIFSSRQEDVLSMLRPPEAHVLPPPVVGRREESLPARMVLLDTSVIIDGRIEDIARTGFLPDTLLIPRFVLNELQHIADSADALRRQRGRRGMEVLAALQKEPIVTVEISDVDAEEASTVDEKLVVLAKRNHSPILTNDYNLNRIADLQGVKILNINELANAVKVVFLPGESLRVEIIQEGKEIGQGVGYLDDGTMIVVENGGQYIGRSVPTIVTKVLQTAAGRMIFARPVED